MPRQCPKCSSTRLDHQGVGTEQLEQNLRALFPDTECIRVDRDSTSRKGSFKTHIEKANRSGACILIGTQMLAKGHHLPRIALAVICDADQALFSYDYRAQEHLGQLITQVAGRTGRDKKQGELIIETNYPDHPFWGGFLGKAYTEFADDLLATRQAQQLPPQTFTAIVRASSPDITQLTYLMNQARSACTNNSSLLEVIGPMPATMERKSGRYRYQLNLASEGRKNLHQTLSLISRHLNNLKGVSKVRWGIDVDPQTLD